MSIFKKQEEYLKDIAINELIQKGKQPEQKVIEQKKHTCINDAGN